MTNVISNNVIDYRLQRRVFIGVIALVTIINNVPAGARLHHNHYLRLLTWRGVAVVISKPSLRLRRHQSPHAIPSTNSSNDIDARHVATSAVKLTRNDDVLTTNINSIIIYHQYSILTDVCGVLRMFNRRVFFAIKQRCDACRQNLRMAAMHATIQTCRARSDVLATLTIRHPAASN